MKGPKRLRIHNMYTSGLLNRKKRTEGVPKFPSILTKFFVWSHIFGQVYEKNIEGISAHLISDLRD